MTDQNKIITDKEMDDLPDDNELAFVVYEQRIRKNTLDVAANQQGSYLERDYVNHILAFINVVNLDLPVDQNPPNPDDKFWAWFNDFKKEIDYHTVAIRLAHARGTGSGITTAIYLSEDYRTEIHKLLDRV